MINKVAVIGGGSWGTALVKIISENHHLELCWYVRSEEDAAHIRAFGHNPRYLSSVFLNTQKIRVSSDLRETIDCADLIVLAVPSAFLHQSLQSLPGGWCKGKKFLSAIKGMIPETRQVVATYLETAYGVDPKDISVVGGPCHAEEVALEKLSYLTVSAEDEDLANHIRELLECRFINCKTNPDLYGAEYAAVLKNIYAIAAGISHGLGYGDNFQAILVSKAIREMEDILNALHTTHRDVKEAAYLGDLLVTAYSQFSRNRTFGNMLGKGYSVTAAQLEMNMVAEGYYAIRPVYIGSKEAGLEPPIVSAVYRIVAEGVPARRAFEELAPLLAD